MSVSEPGMDPSSESVLCLPGHTVLWLLLLSPASTPGDLDESPLPVKPQPPLTQGPARGGEASTALYWAYVLLRLCYLSYFHHWYSSYSKQSVMNTHFTKYGYFWHVHYWNGCIKVIGLKMPKYYLNLLLFLYNDENKSSCLINQKNIKPASQAFSNFSDSAFGSISQSPSGDPEALWAIFFFFFSFLNTYFYRWDE